MKRINIFVEGQTEEVFVQKVLYEHFQPLNIFLTPILIRTGRKGKGGVSSYGKIRKQVNRKCHQDKKSFVSTMFDYYLRISTPFLRHIFLVCTIKVLKNNISFVRLA